MKLVLCAGQRLSKGYVHHDVKALPGIEIVCDLHDIKKHVEPESCERIEFTHALEHFPKTETVPILQMVRGLLQPGGELYLEVPNFAWHAQLVMEGKDEDAVYYCFGGQEDEYDLHKTGFTEKILYKALEDAGYTRIQVFNQTSLMAKAYK